MNLPVKVVTVKYPLWFVFSVLVCVFGNSFLFGYNIGVINSPAETIKLFYAKVHLARDGIETEHRDGVLYYLSNGTTYKSTTNVTTVVVVPLSADANNATNANSTDAVNRIVATVDDNLLDILWSVTVAVFVLFGMIGAFVSGKVADSFGRKRGMILITAIMFLAAVFGGIPKVAMSPECLIISRVLVGLHSGICVSLASLYLAEISPKKIRGAVGTCHQLFITIGILWSMIMGLPEVTGTWNLWPGCFAFNAIPALCCLILFPLCPESPPYLLIKNDEDGARKALLKFRGEDHDINDEIDEMRHEIHRSSSTPTFTLKQLLTTPQLKWPVVIAVVCQVAQQWCGINAVMSYSIFIFEQANTPKDIIPYVIVGQGAINVLATVFAVPLMEKVGRRRLLLLPMCGMVLCFLVLTICLNLMNNPDFEDSKETLAKVCIVVVMIYVVEFAVGLGPIPYIVVSELFRQEPRAVAMSFSLTFNWICNFILVLSFRFIQYNFGYVNIVMHKMSLTWELRKLPGLQEGKYEATTVAKFKSKAIGEYTYVIFIVILVASIVFIFFYVPETKNRSFHDIASSFGRQTSIGSHTGRHDENCEEMQPMGATIS